MNIFDTEKKSAVKIAEFRLATYGLLERKSRGESWLGLFETSTA